MSEFQTKEDIDLTEKTKLQVPKIEKFCCCLDLVTGVTYFSFGLVLLWIIYFIQCVLFGGLGTKSECSTKAEITDLSLNTRKHNLGDRVVWCKHPLLSGSCLWDQVIDIIIS